MSGNGPNGAVYVAGVGMTEFGRGSTSADLLAQRACADAVSDAGIEWGDVEAVFCGHVFEGRVAGQRVARGLGIDGRLVVNVENACASGATALHLAVQHVASGACETALAMGMERLSVIEKGIIPPDDHDVEGMLGRTNPATYGILAKRHMAEFGTSARQLAAVTVKARRNGSRNPRAQMRKETTVDEVLSAPVIADPLTRSQCCPIGDGAAAAVVTAKRPRGASRAVRVAASVLRGGVRRGPGDTFTHHPVTALTAGMAYQRAGVGPEDVDVAEVHDAFTIAEIVHIEDLGFVARGDGARYIESGEADIGGTLPINPSGGLLSRGHPLGASGLAQTFEIVNQLRGDAGPRQVAGAQVGLAQCEGGVVYGLDAGVCSTQIFIR